MTVFQHILLHHPVAWVYNPVFPNAVLFVYVFLMAPVIAARTGGQHLHHQVRRTVYAVGLDFIRVADHHHVRLVFFLFVFQK